jgi:penicillin-binding protein 1C
MNPRLRHRQGAAAALAATGTLLLGVATWRSLMPLPASLQPPATADAPQFVAADGTPLSYSYRGALNATATLPLWRVPPLLREAFVSSEDKRYWQHGGADWIARAHALGDNLRAGRVVRGASTIGEQAVRIAHPRPHGYWSHWVAGFDAARLLRRFGHAQVLEFYLDQVPYGARRRGVVQAARYYFGRDPQALDPAEQLALAVLVRSPTRYDPRRQPRALRRAVDQLAVRMQAAGVITAVQAAAVRQAPITPGHQALELDAGAFVVHAASRARALGRDAPIQRTTLDAPLQRFVYSALARRQRLLAARGVANAAALVVDNRSGAVLAWAVAPQQGPFAIDPVLSPRQPGSTLKPFIYGLAMQRLGWQPDTVLRDTPLAEAVGPGVHRYRNYSGRHYGRVSLRYALANSLNIPAVRTAQAVGVAAIADLLQQLGFGSLRRDAGYYGPAIALGDGAVSLYELVQGYATLARRGRWLPLHVLAGLPRPQPVPLLSPAVSSVLASILSDPDARAAEFGVDSVLDLPYPTAVKTGTSSDYRDSWSVGFDRRYTVGVWMGRLGGGSTDGVTGSSGPAPVLREIFARLRRDEPYAGLWQDPALRRVPTCEWIGPPPCVLREDWRLPGPAAPASARPPAIARPLPGETLALDPRLPRRAQVYRFAIDTAGGVPRRVDWQLDGRTLSSNRAAFLDWRISGGAHRLQVRLWLRGAAAPRQLGPVDFTVLGARLPAPALTAAPR